MSSIPENIKIEEEIKKKKISFSQFRQWNECPAQWKLNYLEGKRIYEASIHTCFGTAIHTVLQAFIKTLYTEGRTESNKLNLNELFDKEFLNEVTKNKLVHTKEDFESFTEDGKTILKSFTSNENKLKFFPSNKYEFVGIELPIDMPIKFNLQFVAFIDLVLREKQTGRIKIFDFKTSSVEWNKYQKTDDNKVFQVLLYKAFYSKAFNVPLEMIDVEFFILKRKLYENVNYKQDHIQIFTPSHTKPAVSNAVKSLIGFINECFTPDGQYNKDGFYPKIPGTRNKHCKYCTHKGINCDGKADKLPDEEL